MMIHSISLYTRHVLYIYVYSEAPIESILMLGDNKVSNRIGFPH